MRAGLCAPLPAPGNMEAQGPWREPDSFPFVPQFLGPPRGLVPSASSCTSLWFLSFFIPMGLLSKPENSSFRESVDDGDSPISQLLGLQAPDEAIRSKVCLGRTSSALLGEGAPLLGHLERDKPGCLVAVSVCNQHLARGAVKRAKHRSQNTQGK